MDTDHTKQKRILSYLTIMTTFLMGFIDAYTFAERGGTFASAQTGNMVSFGAKIFTGKWADAAGHVSVFLGFTIGAFLGEAVIQKFSILGLRKYRIFILTQTVLLLLLAVFQVGMADSLMVFFLGLLAGYELTTFRSFRGTSTNNGIMTGNTKNLMNSLYVSIFSGDRKAMREWNNLFTVIIVFIVGVGAGTLIMKIDAILNLWAAFALNVCILIWLVASRKNTV